MQRKVKYAALLILVFIPFIVWAAQKTMTTYMWDSNIQVKASNLHIIDFEKDIADMTPGTSTTGAMTVDTVNKTANLGNGRNDSCGVLWYGGINALVAKCIDGKCDFGCGFRAYFDFRFLSTDTSTTSTTLGDGFTFAVINGANNSTSTRGGPGSGSMGELMCYAGSGGSGGTAYGLRSPKLAIEFDTYGNTGAMAADGCSGGRADESNALNHLGLIFWGDNKTGNCSAGCTSCLKASYDDNIHGQCAGSCTNPGPINSATGDGTGGYCQRTGGKVDSYNWMEDGHPHRVRIEVTRATTPSGSTYPYNIKAWVDCEGACCSGSTCTTCPAGELTAFQNVFSAYTNASYPPKINRTVQLGTTDHNNFEKMIFGWTEGTGGATQSIEISNFKIYFPCSTACYNYSITPASALLGSSASTGNTVAVTTDIGCPWGAVSNDSWITITGGESGTGSGTVTYSVGANDGVARTGTITIAGKTFTISQASGCTYSINPSSRLHSSAAASGQTVAVTAGAGCPWTAVSNNAWITVTGGASGTGSGTVIYSITANSGAARTGTITIGDQTFTITQAAYIPCTLTIADNSFACKDGWGNERVYIKVYLTDGAGNPVTSANVTYSVSGSGSGTLTDNGGGYYGGTRNSDCGLGGDCARTGNLWGSRTVTVTATHGTCSGSPLTKTMTVP